MREISVFDVVGPNMIGPSSSHTAGALRIALMAGKISKGKPKKVKFILYGSFAMTYKGHGTDKALLAGILGMNTEDYRIRDSFRLADEAGIEYEFVPCTENKGYHPNTVEVVITNEEGQLPLPFWVFPSAAAMSSSSRSMALTSACPAISSPCLYSSMTVRVLWHISPSV